MTKIFKREINFNKSTLYHVVARAVDGMKIYANQEDRLRFIFQMYVANIGKPRPNLRRKNWIKIGQAILNGEQFSNKLIVIEHPPLVNFLGFVLVVNHCHFELVPNVSNGISKYMRKLKTGFAMYFNSKHERRGNVFERPYKVVPIKTDFQSDAVLFYINIKNVLDIYQPGWRKKGLKNEIKAFEFLNKYQFSSFLDLFGKRNSKIIAPPSIREKYLGEGVARNQKEYRKFIKDYLADNLSQYNSLFLE